MEQEDTCESPAEPPLHQGLWEETHPGEGVRGA